MLMHSKRNRIVAILLGMVGLLELALHLVPLRILDTSMLQLSIVVCLLQAILVYVVGRQFFPKNSWKLNLLILIPFVMCVLNFLIYYARLHAAFMPKNTGETMGTIVRIYQKGGGRSPERHFVEFEYEVMGETFQHAHELEQFNRAGVKVENTVEVTYHLRDPGLSRLETSLQSHSR